MQYNGNFSRPLVYKSVSDENSLSNSQKINLNDNNVRIFFAKSASSEYVTFSDGKVMIKSFGVLDKIGYAFLAVGAFSLYIVLRSSDSGIGLFLTGLVLALIGVLIISFVKTFSVIDYRSKSIYSETLFKGNGIWKSNKSTAFSNIVEISVDYRQT